jgi:hypothetical protein
MLGLGNALTNSTDAERTPFRAIILMMPTGTTKSGSGNCSYSGSMVTRTILSEDVNSPQVGDQVTQSDAPTYSPITIGEEGANFKATIGSTNYNFTLENSSTLGQTKTLITAITAC